jgi:hypothetical protein
MRSRAHARIHARDARACAHATPPPSWLCALTTHSRQPILFSRQMQDNFKMAVDVPGVESDKLNIEAEGNVLRIRRAFAHVCDAFCASLRIFAYR